MSKWNSYREANHFIENYFNKAMRILAGESWGWEIDPITRRHDYVRAKTGRDWFKQQYTRHLFHPAVHDMMELYRPDDWQQLLLEFPHKSITDPSRLAYTRDEKSAMHDGDSDKKAVVTTIGKYLRRHFSDAPDNLIRDISAKYTYGGTTAVTRDPDAMVKAVIDGPRSCMSSDFDIRCDDGVRRHPYAVYDPSLGWGMAVRKSGEEIMGRCLVWHDPDNEDSKGYVRSYKREADSRSHSGTDEAIEVFLQAHGYARWLGWPEGTPVRSYAVGSGYLMPYIDGGNQHVEAFRGGDTLNICDCGDWGACNTNGLVNAHECTCEDCGAGYDAEDGYTVGVHEDRQVCPNCFENYKHVYGRRGRTYYVDDDRVVYVDGESYDSEYLSDNSIVELHDGTYAHHDNAIFIASTEEYYRVDDEDVCYAQDSNQYELVSDCWQCAESGNWYTDDEDSVEVDGELYHPDNAPEEYAEDDEEEDEAVVTASEPELTLAMKDLTAIEERIIAIMVDEATAAARDLPETPKITGRNPTTVLTCDLAYETNPTI